MLWIFTCIRLCNWKQPVKMEKWETEMTFLSLCHEHGGRHIRSQDTRAPNQDQARRQPFPARAMYAPVIISMCNSDIMKTCADVCFASSGTNSSVPPTAV